MKKANWYLDFISPYAYLQSAIIEKITGKIFLSPKPILFAGLLNHYGHLGPAEIPSKRKFVMQQSLWLAKKYNVPIKMPPFHPFNPLPTLRLALAIGENVEKINQIFEFIWREGRNIEDAKEFVTLGKLIGIDDPIGVIQNISLKQKLKEQTDFAISEGVFGVPTVVIDELIFWGLDSTESLLSYLENPASFNDSIVKPASSLPEGTAKRKK